MKIGILTQPLHRNYGGILQNWALQQVLIGMGHRPEMIFLSRGRHSRGGLLVMRCVSFVKSMVKRYLCGCKNVYLNSVFSPQYNPTVPLYADANFVRHIHKTRPLGTDDMDIGKFVASRSYDAFIVGSDQVWREDYSPSITCYFLDFLSEGDKRPRVAYAASFGKSKDYISEKYLPVCRKLLRRFDAVSVREYEGLEILERDFGFFKGVKVLDPTLLLPMEKYRTLIKDEDRAHHPHIAAYILDPSEEIQQCISSLGTQFHLPIKIFRGEHNGEKMLSISQWLAEFEKAEFVMTDSFHGCVFSIIFQKPFICLGNKYRGMERFHSLLEPLGLSDRLVSAESFSLPDSDINWQQVNEKLEQMRISSRQFLTEALGN